MHCIFIPLPHSNYKHTLHTSHSTPHTPALYTPSIPHTQHTLHTSHSTPHTLHYIHHPYLTQHTLHTSHSTPHTPALYTPSIPHTQHTLHTSHTLHTHVPLTSPCSFTTATELLLLYTTKWSGVSLPAVDIRGQYM